MEREEKVCICGANMLPLLRVTVVNARFEDNSCFSEPSPYIIARYGDSVFRTRTDIGCHPYFRNTFTCHLLPMVDLKVDLRDEGIFTDKLLASCMIPIPLVILNETNVDAWYNVFKNKTNRIYGKVHLVISCSTSCPHCVHTVVCNRVGHDYGLCLCEVYTVSDFHMNATTYVPGSHVMRRSSANREDCINTLTSMFPNLDKDVIAAVALASGYRIERAVDACLEVSK